MFGFFVTISLPISFTKELDYRLEYWAISYYPTNDSIAFILQLLDSMRVHHIFPVSFLEPYTTFCISGRNQLPPPPIEVDGNKEYKVEEILDPKFV